MCCARLFLWECAIIIADDGHGVPQAVEELGAVSLNELHDFVAARWRGAVPAAQACLSHYQKHSQKQL